MNNKQFNVVAAVTAVLFIWAVVLAATGRDVVVEFVRGQALLPDLDVGRLNKIRITKGSNEVVLEKRGEGFLVVSRESYPADSGRINNLIQQASGITCGREITTSKDAHADLEVDGKSENSTVVRFLDGDQEIVGVVVGKYEDGGNYVRLTKSDTVYQSEKSVFLDSDALNFVDKDLLSIEKLETVEVSGGDKPFVIKRDGTSSKLQDVPEGMVVKGGMDNQVFSAVRNLTFSDFVSEEDVEKQKKLKGISFPRKFVATTEAGERYTLSLGKHGNDWYCKATAKYVGPATLSKEELEKSKNDPELLKKQEAILQAGDKCQKFVNKHQSWVYKVAGYAAEDLTRNFADLIEEDKEFLKLGDDSVATVTSTKGEQSFTLASPKQGVVQVAQVPEGKKAKPFVPDQVFGAIKGFRWTERFPPNDKLLEGVEFDAVYKVTLRDGAEYTFAIGQNKDARKFVKPSAAFTGDPKDEKPAAVIARGAVAKFNERHKGNVYEVGAGAVDSMLTPAADLFMDQAARPEEIQASHILIAFKGAERSEQTRTKAEAKKLAEDLLVKVKAAPDDFAKFAKEHSDGPSKDQGGDLNRFKFDGMTKPFSEAAFKLEPGEISGVVETEFGFHIIKRTK